VGLSEGAVEGKLEGDAVGALEGAAVGTFAIAPTLSRHGGAAHLIRACLFPAQQSLRAA
jgi:hypothetical protein